VTTYVGSSAAASLAEAQRAFDVHVTSSATGRCLSCGAEGPCVARERASVVFARSMWLPRRRPGATRPELLGARQIVPRRDR
jgi:hypothetical protein